MLLVLTMVSCSSNDPESMIEHLYDDCILTVEARQATDFKKLGREMWTPRLRKYLNDDLRNITEPESDEDYAISPFISEWGGDYGDNPGPSKFQKATYLGDNWYKVNYLYEGQEGESYILFVESDGKMKMDEVTCREPTITHPASEENAAPEKNKNKKKEKIFASDSEKVLKSFKNLIKSDHIVFDGFSSATYPYPIIILSFKPSKEDDDMGIAVLTKFQMDRKSYNDHSISYTYTIKDGWLNLFSGDMKYETYHTDDHSFKIYSYAPVNDRHIRLGGMYKGKYTEFDPYELPQKEQLMWGYYETE